MSPFPTCPFLVFSLRVALFPLGYGTINTDGIDSSVVGFPVDVSDDVGVVVDSADFLKSIAVVDVDKMDAAFLSAAFLSRVGSCQELPTVAKLQTAYTSHQNLPEISQLIL